MAKGDMERSSQMATQLTMQGVNQTGKLTGQVMNAIGQAGQAITQGNQFDQKMDQQGQQFDQKMSQQKYQFDQNADMAEQRFRLSARAQVHKMAMDEKNFSLQEQETDSRLALSEQYKKRAEEETILATSKNQLELMRVATEKEGISKDMQKLAIAQEIDRNGGDPETAFGGKYAGLLKPKSSGEGEGSEVTPVGSSPLVPTARGMRWRNSKTGKLGKVATPQEISAMASFTRANDPESKKNRLFADLVKSGDYSPQEATAIVNNYYGSQGQGPKQRKAKVDPAMKKIADRIKLKIGDAAKPKTENEMYDDLANRYENPDDVIMRVALDGIEKVRVKSQGQINVPMEEAVAYAIRQISEEPSIAAGAAMKAGVGPNFYKGVDLTQKGQNFTALKPGEMNEFREYVAAKEGDPTETGTRGFKRVLTREDAESSGRRRRKWKLEAMFSDWAKENPKYAESLKTKYGDLSLRKWVEEVPLKLRFPSGWKLVNPKFDAAIRYTKGQRDRLERRRKAKAQMGR